MQAIEELLTESDRVAISAIAGMGGVGKTELAIRYATDHQAEFPGGVCWLSVREQDPAEQVLLFASVRLGLEVLQQFNGRSLTLLEQVKWCWQHWKPSEGSVLLVLDDVTEWKRCRQVLEGMPSRFRVLMTTRLQPDRSIPSVSLHVLPPRKAIQLLGELVGRDRLRQEPWIARKLLKWLEYLPLGIELVGRYLDADPDLSLAKMLQRLEKQKLDAKAIDYSESELEETYFRVTAKRGVRAAIGLSWQALSPEARQLGCVLGLFAAAEIPWRLVEGVMAGLGWEEEAVELAKRELVKWHLVQWVEVGVYRIHALIRVFLQEQLTQTEAADAMKRSFVEVMIAVAQQIPHDPTLDLIQIVTPDIPHLKKVSKDLLDFLTENALMWSFVGVGWFYEGQGLYSSAEPWLVGCLDAVRSLLGKTHPHVATSLNNLAVLYQSQGRYEAAEPLFQQALQLMRALLGETHLDVATSLNNLAELYRVQGRYEAAEPLFQQVLQLRRSLLGETHLDVATSLNNLALL
ncbi:tetratricopeptide repeat protein, partial [Phormidesmis sp. 146-12]